MLARIAAGLGVLLLALLVVGFVAGASALRSFRPPTESTELRHELKDCLNVPCDSDVEVALPAWLAALGRVGASLADLEPEVVVALKTVHAGGVGVYRLAEAPAREDALHMLKLADARLVERRGWPRVVTVLDTTRLVAVYAADPDPQSRDTIDVFLIMLDGRDLVIAAARGCPRPLFEFVSTRSGRIQPNELHL